MTDKLYVLMDGRAHTDMERAIILDTGTRKEMFDLQREGIYGDGCVVVTPEGEIEYDR